MKKIITSLSVIVAVSAIAIGATSAFLSDTETSSGNTFAAGAIDLKIDNESYYNRVLNAATTWLIPDDLVNGRLFFNFTDLKPDDEGEDTISLHVNDNDAYLCMDMTLTSNDDESSNEPELGSGDAQENINDTWDGELAQNLQMFWWADDGDNVYEVGENPITNGVQTVANLFGEDRQFSVALADSQNNIWTPNAPGAIPGDTTQYIAKAWCFGNLGLAPLAPDNGDQGRSPSDPTGPGVTCDGTLLGNETQTDGVTLDVAFRAFQARHVPGFLCSETTPRTATLTVNKVIVTDNGGNETISSFQLAVIGTVVTNVTSGVATSLAAGNYVVTETGVSGYQATISGDCNAAGQITLASGDNKTCTITNNDIAPSITLIKNVVNNGSGTALPIQFTMRIDGTVVPQNTSVAVSANTSHSISEDAFSGYTLTGVSGAGCPATIPGNVTLNEGQAITCTITNDDN
ncbi:hypothetical protein HYT00_03600 [Candidatus Giovannonibacteria bacterium]|nr:hypothetical protein [Candidatus Giovannonibacteria bacterium]